MSPQNKYSLEASTDEPESITILRGGYLLAQKLIPLIEKGESISIEAHREGLLVACIASQLLEPKQRGVVLGITLVSVLSAIHALRKHELQKFIKKQEHGPWDFGKLLGQHQNSIQDDLKEAIKQKIQLPYITTLICCDCTLSEVPEALQPSFMVIDDITCSV